MSIELQFIVIGVLAAISAMAAALMAMLALAPPQVAIAKTRKSISPTGARPACIGGLNRSDERSGGMS